MTDTPAESAEDPRTPELTLKVIDWMGDETQCPCGKPAGPDFRYGLCDECANKTPPSALLRWGMTRGSVETRVRAALAARDARVRDADRLLEAIQIRCREGDKRCDWLPTIDKLATEARALLSEGKPGQ